MDREEEIKDKTKRLVYYLITQKNDKRTPLEILNELHSMASIEVDELFEKRKILKKIIEEEIETQHLQKLVELNYKD